MAALLRHCQLDVIIVKNSRVVNSDAGVVSVVDQGITGSSTLRCVFSASQTLVYDTTSVMAASTCATPETVESSVQSVSPSSNCCGAGLGHLPVLFHKTQQFSN